MESTQHFWCLSRGRGGELVWRNSLCALGCPSLGPVCCLGMATSLFAPHHHPTKAGFSSARRNCVDSFVLSVSLWISCGMVQSQGLLWVSKKSFPFWLGSQILMGELPVHFALFCCCLFCFVFNHYVLQLLVYMRIVELVCTLINSPLKCFWLDHFLVSLLKLL